MNIFIIFSKMKSSIRYRVVNHKPGLYLSLVFPIAVAFLITFGVARLISLYWPALTISWTSTFRVHHFVYGIFVLMASGYLALVFSGPRAKFLISLLHGFALGLTFDEIWFWLKLSDSELERWSYDGLLIFVGLIFLIISAPYGIRALGSILPIKKKYKKEPEKALENPIQPETTTPKLPVDF